MSEDHNQSSSRYLIALGFPTCDLMELEFLEHVQSDVGRVVNYFIDTQGFTRVLADSIPVGASASKVRSELSRWFACKEREPEDIVVIYIAGHGGPAGRAGRHHIFTTDSYPREPSETALETARLGQIFFDGEGLRPQNVMLILDTCYAGKGGGQVAAMLAEAKASIQDAPGSGVWVIASAGPTSGAADGAFVAAFLDTVGHEDVSPHGNAMFVDPVTLVWQINEFFREQKLPQVADIDVIGAGRGPRPFLRNVNCTRRRDGVPLADELHWNPKARGVEEFSSTGWFFTGRESALRELVSWLNADEWDGHARVVTGRPGSGKSALLGWLVLCTHKESRIDMERAGVALQMPITPDVGSIDVAIHARGLGVDDALKQLSDRLDKSEPEVTAILRRLQESRQRVRILVDAVDESSEPDRLEQNLLRPLQACSTVRLIVGSRRMNDRLPLEETAKVIDLDAPAYFDVKDIAHYVETRLTGSDPRTVYGNKTRHADARRIAQRVAQKADKSFLYARVVSRRIAVQPPLDTGQDGWERKLPLPDALTRAFDLDLERFSEEQRKRFVDLLVPLAYSRGKGLPQKQIWSLVASRVAQRGNDQAYSNGDIRELKEKAGFYIVQDSEHDEVVYRLFHQEFANYIRAKTRDEAVEFIIAETLWSLDDRPLGRGGWLRRADPYVMHYLPAHAAAGGLLESLLGEPDFLLKVPPEALVPHLAMMPTGASRAIARAYRKASGSLRGKEESDRRAYLLTALLQEGAEETFRKLRETAASWLWIPIWARWTAPTPSYVICKGKSPISAIAAAEWQPGRTVALIGREDSSVEVWDLESGDQLDAWRPAERNSTHLVSLVSSTEGRLLIASWMNGDLGIMNLATRQEEWQRPESEQGVVTALSVTYCDDRPVCIIATRDLRLRVCALPSLAVIKERPNATAASIYALKLINIGEHRLLMSGGDSVRSRVRTEKRLLRIWTFPDLDPLWEDDRTDKECIRYLELGNIAGQILLVCSQDAWGPFEIWDPLTRTLLYRANYPCNQAWFVELENNGFLISHLAGSISVLRVCVEAGVDLRLEAVGDGIRVEGKWFSLVQLHGRPALLSSDLDHVRVWDIAELMTEPSEASRQRFSILDVSALTAGRASDGKVFVGTGGGELIAMDGDTGSEHWRLRLGERTSVSALSYLPRAEQRLLVTADSDGMIQAIDLDTQHEARAPISAGREILALVACEWRGQAFAFATVRNSSGPAEWATRVWDLDTGREVTSDGSHRRRFRWSLRHGEEDKRMRGLAIGKLETMIRVAFSSKYGKVMVADLGNADPAVNGEEFEEWWIPDSAGGYTGSLAVSRAADTWLLAAGTEDGELVVWDFQTGAMNKLHQGAHLGPINVLFFNERGEILVSGGNDGRLKFWTARLDALFDIDIGEAITSATWLDSNRLTVGTGRGALTFDVNGQRVATLTYSLK